METSGPTNAPYSPGLPRWVDGRLVDESVSTGIRLAAVSMHLWWLTVPLLGPFALIVPVTLWASLQGRSGFLDDHGREALNAQLTLLVLLVVPVCGWILLVPWIPVWLFGSIRAAIAAGSGAYDRYPVIFRALR
jgi:uncharacterized Tic20 family protein